MDMKAIKQYFRLRDRLIESGVIGLNLYDKRVHVRIETMTEFPGVAVQGRLCEKYPFEIYAESDGITFFSLASPDELERFEQIRKFYQ